MPPTRRAVLGWAAAALGAAPLINIAASGSAAAASSLPITVVNNTGSYGNSSIWMYVVGTDPASGKQAYVNGSGQLTDVSLSLNGSDGYADLSIPLAGSGNSNLNLPNMSGRIYFSINDKLKFKVVTDGNGNAALQYPAGWVTSDPNYNILHDCVEFTFNGSGMYCNATQVDMFSIPLALNLTGASNQTTGTLKAGGRSAIFSAIAGQSDFAPLIVGDNLRVIAPGHGIDAGIFSSTYFDSYINDAWSTYTNTDLVVTANNVTYTGRVSGDTLTFSGGPAPFSKPSTQDVFYCNGALAAPNDGVTGPVAAVLGAGLNRSVLNSTPNQPVTDSSQYYQGAVTNHYSAAIHASMADGKAYGFPFDDVCSYASYVQDTAPTALSITLTSFS
ncbi:beta-1,3-glucanase family protein [Streptomyces sp. SL13]|uniref:Beta-1,3-glucanase family protein n=1 Tax=Streptantibioticus silvisoli TaxID=2705255 RepID=A0AA90KF89_9ACTN|nr:beta-1,3-glucanase family protein [Streptantibioticus silvisoli]MDI5968955.1 beta-1,3-glucanase family protein [Streptantibioticus silvisoli]